MKNDLLDDLIYSTRHGAGFILRRFGRIIPGGVYFVNCDDPRMDFVFPKEDHPKASDEEVFGMVVDKLRRRAARPETCGVALAVEIERDGQRYLALQAETRERVVVRHYPIRKSWLGWSLGEAVEAEELVADRFFADTSA